MQSVLSIILLSNKEKIGCIRIAAPILLIVDIAENSYFYKACYVDFCKLIKKRNIDDSCIQHKNIVLFLSVIADNSFLPSMFVDKPPKYKTLNFAV